MGFQLVVMDHWPVHGKGSRNMHLHTGEVMFGDLLLWVKAQHNLFTHTQMDTQGGEWDGACNISETMCPCLNCLKPLSHSNGTRPRRFTRCWGPGLYCCQQEGSTQRRICR